MMCDMSAYEASEWKPKTLREQTAEEIRVLLARRRVSGVWLADQMGKSQSYVSRRLNADLSFDVDDLELIAQVLDTTVERLLTATVTTRAALRVIQGDGIGSSVTQSPLVATVRDFPAQSASFVT